MSEDTSREATRFLRAAAAGDDQAARELFPLVYRELHRLARSRMAHLAPGQTLQPTALVHEAYMRLIEKEDKSWDGHGHFLAAAARAMRDILVESARRKASLKRGGERRREEFNEEELAIEVPGGRSEDLVALDDALRKLEADDPRKGEVVNLRYFAGLTAEETAAALDVSVSTVEREWRYVKSWLFQQLSDGGICDG